MPLIFNETLKDTLHGARFKKGKTVLISTLLLWNSSGDPGVSRSHRESILKTAKALVEDTKLLVAGAASSQEKLAQAAHSSAKTITQLTEVVKMGATSMGSEGPETQVLKKQKTCLIRHRLSELCDFYFLSWLSY